MKIIHGNPKEMDDNEIINLWLDTGENEECSFLRYHSSQLGPQRYNFIVSLDPVARRITVWEKDIHKLGLTLKVEPNHG